MENQKRPFPEVNTPIPAEMLDFDEKVIASGKVVQEEGNKFFVSDKADTSDDRYKHAAFLRIAEATFNVRVINIAPERQRIQLEI